ncbi:transcription factor GTE1-like [Arachis stenosperma]|uniref:transcription factor GTE1-like n=1 Tax=Arachis stenosperma TaxID=217475 RepID=UPI0025AC7D1E|nr:transcription factor GTE1-like [Arachis stenosperma]
MAALNSSVTEEDLNGFRFSIDQIQTQVVKLEKQVNEVEQFYQSNDFKVNNSKNKGENKHLIGTKKSLQGDSHNEADADAAKGREELMRQFSVILSQITQHEWAWPFMDPVDVEGLGLYDYYEVINKPMDFSTIKRKMEAKDGSGYKNVREIYSDVRLIFKNAMKYNDKKNEVHVMARTLLNKFEEKWLLLLPKVDQEERRHLKEEADAQLETQLAQEATYANMTRDLSVELDKVDVHLKSLKALVIQNCRKLSSQEKVLLGTALPRLSPEYLIRALQIVHENNPNFQPNAEVVELDINSQNDYTLWRLNVFVKHALKVQGRTAEGTGVDHSNKTENKNYSKRRRVL